VTSEGEPKGQSRGVDKPDQRRRRASEGKGERGLCQSHQQPAHGGDGKAEQATAKLKVAARKVKIAIKDVFD